VPAQDKFKAKHKLTIALASDEKRKMLEAYGVWQQKSLYGRKFMGIVRMTFLIGPTSALPKCGRRCRLPATPRKFWPPPRRYDSGAPLVAEAFTEGSKIAAAFCRLLTINGSNPYPAGTNLSRPVGASMSQWTASRSLGAARPQQPAQYAAQQPGRDGARRPEAHPRAVTQAPARSGYTIAHAGRQVRFGPVAFWIAVGTVVILAGWSVTTATYFAFSDDVVKGLISRQAEQQFAYEDRIAELRAQIDRTTSRQLLDQEQFEQKLDDLTRRQAALESHATAMSGIADRPSPARSNRRRRRPPRRAAAGSRASAQRSTASRPPSIASSTSSR